MSEAGDAFPADAGDPRRRLHDASGQLSNAVLQLSLLLEDATLEPSRRRELELALEACRAAARHLKALWPLLPGR
jgi:hypothetical protein